MKEFNPIATIKKYKFWIIAISLLASIVCYVALNAQQSYTAAAIIEYTNKEASEGKTPDGSTIDPSEIYSTSVMKEVFQRMGLEFEDYNLDKFRSKVVVKAVLSDEEETVQTALNEKGEEMTSVPTKYSVSLTVDKQDAAEPRVFARQMLENMLDVYLKYYGEEYVSGSLIVSDIVRMEESGFDYIEAVEAIDEAVSNTVTSLENIISGGSSFRSTATGYSFADLHREFVLVADNEIPEIYAYVLNNRITRDADVLISKYRQRIEDYKIENEGSLREIEDIKEIIAAYIDMMRQSGNTNITYEYILDEVYDTYYQDRTTADENGDHPWVNPDETIEYEVLLEDYIEDRTDYEYAMIQIAYCEYIIENYGGTVEAAADIPVEGAVEGAAVLPQTGEPLTPVLGATGDEAGAKAMIDDLMVTLDDLYAKLTVVKAEYNEYSGADNVGLITNIVVNADVQVLLYTLILMIFCLVGISAVVIFVDRVSDILDFYVYMDRKFLVGNRSACDRYLNKHERSVLDGATVCVAVNVTNLRGKNKEFGREACDDMIRALVQLMKKVFPGEPDCFMALNGQGQFVVFVEGIREAQAKAYMKYLGNEVAAYNAQAKCPIEYHYGIAEAEKEDIFQMRGLLVSAVNQANSPAAAAKN